MVTVIYPKNAQSAELHTECRKNLSGTHAGNLYCVTHEVPVKRTGE